MAYIVPDSVITLYNNVPITNQEQIAFKTLAQQKAYFATKILRSKVNCSYVRRNGRLKIEDGMGLMLNCNYISFRNPSFENKTIYARVIDYAYINNTTVEIQYVIDWFQTFMFDVTYEDAVMDREHLSVADWNKIEANPYDRSVYEMFTPENLPAGKELEKIYSSYSPITTKAEAGSSSSYLLSNHDIGFTQAYKPCIAMLISNYDTAEIGVDIFQDFDVVIDSKGNYISNTPTGSYNELYDYISYTGSTLPVRVPRAFSIGLIGCDSSLTENLKLDNFKQIVDNLTYAGLTQQVIGVYLISYSFVKSYVDYVNGGENNSYYQVTPPSYISNITNRKLATSPFTYIRVEDENGDSKEFRFEDFIDLQTNQANPKLFLVSNIDGLPEMAIVPFKYKYGFDNQPDIDNVNLRERISFNAFPQIGYTTDAYLSYLGAQYTENLQGRTTGSEELARANSNMNYITKAAGAAGGIVTGAWSGMKAGWSAGGPLGAVAGALGGAVTGTVSGSLSERNARYADYNLQHGYSEADAYRDIGGADVSAIASGDVPSAVYDEAKAGFVADNYVAGSNGSLSYYAGVVKNAGSFKITRVQLRDVFVQKYDAYFTHYGYSSSRIGVPRICNFMANSSNNAELPKFLKQTNGYSMTYVKTQSMNVNATMKPVSDFIEQMFNNGMRFIDGSTL